MEAGEGWRPSPVTHQSRARGGPCAPACPPTLDRGLGFSLLSCPLFLVHVQGWGPASDRDGPQPPLKGGQPQQAAPLTERAHKRDWRPGCRARTPAQSPCSGASPVLCDAGPALLEAGEGRRPKARLASGHGRNLALPSGLTSTQTCEFPSAPRASPSETLLSNLHANKTFHVASELVRDQVEDYFSPVVQRLKMKQTLDG